MCSSSLTTTTCHGPRNPPTMVSMRWRKEPPSPDLPDHDSNEPLSTEELATLDHGLGASHHAYPTPSSNPSRDQLTSNNKTPHTIYSVPNASGSLTVNSLLSVRAPETVTKRKSQNSLAKSFRRVSSAVSLSKGDKERSSSSASAAASASDTSLSSPTYTNGSANGSSSRTNLVGVPETKPKSRQSSQVNIPPVPPLPSSSGSSINLNGNQGSSNINSSSTYNGYLNPIYSHTSDISPNTSTANIPTIIHPNSDTNTGANPIRPTHSNMSSHSVISALSNANESVDSFQSVTQDFSEVVLVPTNKSNGTSPLPTSASQFARSVNSTSSANTSPVKASPVKQEPHKQYQGQPIPQLQFQAGQFHARQSHQTQQPREPQFEPAHPQVPLAQLLQDAHQPAPVNTVQEKDRDTNGVNSADDDSVSVDSPVDDDPAVQSAVESVQSRVGESQQTRVPQSLAQTQPSLAQSLGQTNNQAIPVRSANKEFMSSVAPAAPTVTGSSSRPSLAAAMRGGLSDTPAIPMAAATTAVSSMSPKSQNSMTESVSALSSPASSMIFERNVQEFSVAATSAGASSSKIWHNHDNTHYHGEDRVAPALDASTEAIINSKVNPEDIDVISLRRPSSIRARSPTEASLNSLWSPGSPTMLQDASSGGPRTRNNSMSVHPLTASHTGGSLSPDKLNGGDGRQVLSFCSFADVVHTENEETTASSDRLGRFDTRSQSALRSPSPLMRQHHPVSPSMAESVVADLKLTIPPSRSATVDSLDSESPIVVSSFGETIRRRTSELGL
ncbi:hypothetical protein B0I72DRAFT_140492 [Yarrowia lipolytica]|nr:hypothetical protein B0I72DRAFT_140492 [Yarrowia lipolytica]